MLNDLFPAIISLAFMLAAFCYGFALDLRKVQAANRIGQEAPESQLADRRESGETPELG